MKEHRAKLLDMVDGACMEHGSYVGVDMSKGQSMHASMHILSKHKAKAFGQVLVGKGAAT